MKNPGKFIRKFSPDIICLFLLTLTLPLFFYKLGQSSLVSWDEAWYAGPAQTIVKTGDIFNLVFNGSPFYEHPPGGVWIMALFFKLFGISEFSARLGSAALGLGSLYITYLLGKHLFSRVVGLASALALCSSYWFLSRARLADLDVFLTFFFLLTIYLAALASKNRKFFLPFSLSLAFLVTIKSFLPFAILPALLLIFWKSKIYRLKDFLLPLVLTISIYGIWLLFLFLKDPLWLSKHFFHSMRGSSLENNFTRSLELFRVYLHNGIGKWFWPGILGLLTGLLLRKKNFLILVVLFLSYSIPFLFSQELHIWHLIPLHPLIILLFFGSVYTVLSIIAVKLKIKYSAIFISAFILLISFYFSSLQIRAAWFQFIDIPAYVSDEAILSKEAGKYPGKIYIDDDFEPAGAFYSGRVVTNLKGGDIKQLLKVSKEDLLLITYKWRLEQAGLEEDVYEILKQDRDKLLIRGRF